MAQKAMKDNLGILTNVLNSEALLHKVAHKCVERKLISPEDSTLIFDRHVGQPLQERVRSFIEIINQSFESVPENLDVFLCIIHDIDTIVSIKAAKNIAHSCKF